MGFEKGHKHANGRPKGAKNKTTILGKDILKKYFFEDGGLNRLLRDIDAMDSERDRANSKIKLLEYIMPKQKEIELSGDITPTTLQIHLASTTGVPPITSESDVKE